MASSNVQYYQKQRELQTSITNCEQERIDLERQFHVAMKADQTTAKMKATRLHTYWRKVCEDERRAKQRNAMLMKEFERIDDHMSELNSRTQRLAIMKKQYEEYISRTYPKWNELVQGTQQHPELSTNQPQGTLSELLKHPQLQESPRKFNIGSSSAAEVSVGKKIDGRTKTSELMHTQKNENENQTQHHHQWQKQQNSQEKELYTQQVVSRQTAEAVSGIYANLSNSQSDNQKLHQTETSDHALARHHTPQETMSDKKMMFQSTGSGKTVQATNTMHPEETEDDEEISDFGSGSDLPMGQSLGNTQIRVDIQPTSGKTGSSLKINGSMKTELSIDGLINLLQHVEFDMVDAFSCEDFYRRSSLPSTANKDDIIRKSNCAGDLSKVDTSMITMVVLEQIRNIVLNLTEKCLLPENLLQNVSSLTEAILRQHLSPEAQVIWDALYAHFGKLIQCDVMKPSELAAVFTPCLVSEGSSLDKAQKFIVQLLQEVATSTTGITVISKANRITSPAKKTIETLMEEEKVPPLKFGSLLDKPLSDDESSYINSSLPRDPVPLKETEAYKSMVSVNDRSQPHRQLSGHDDTDDDVEKQIASAIVKHPITLNPTQKRVAVMEEPSETSSQTLQTSPHVFIHTAMGPRQTVNAAKTLPSKFQGIKIGSDLDTDTEVDAGIFGSSRRPEENSDFDFYD